MPQLPLLSENSKDHELDNVLAGFASATETLGVGSIIHPCTYAALSHARDDAPQRRSSAGHEGCTTTVRVTGLEGMESD